MATWTIGAVSVTRVEEQIGFASFPPEQYLAGFERELLQRHLPSSKVVRMVPVSTTTGKGVGDPLIVARPTRPPPAPDSSSGMG